MRLEGFNLNLDLESGEIRLYYADGLYFVIPDDTGTYDFILKRLFNDIHGLLNGRRNGKES